jgi:hypothetical protein
MTADTIDTEAIAHSVLRRHVTLVTPEKYAYPEILSLQAAANLELLPRMHVPRKRNTRRVRCTPT